MSLVQRLAVPALVVVAVVGVLALVMVVVSTPSMAYEPMRVGPGYPPVSTFPAP